MRALIRHPLVLNRKKAIFVSVILLLGALGIMYIWMNRDSLSSTYAAANGTTNFLESGWDSMSGVSPQPDGLHVTYTNHSIVRQDGSLGMSIPSINLYGTHLYSDGDYTLKATVDDLDGAAMITLYPSPPLTQDEFYTLPKHLELIISDKTATLNIWDTNRQKNPYAQTPSSTITRSLTSSPHHTLVVQHDKNELIINVDDTQIYTGPYRSIFKNEIWFGLTAQQPNQTWRLKNFELISKGNRTHSINTQTAAYSDLPAASTTLQTLAKQQRPGFQVGVAAALAPTVADSDYQSIVYNGHFGVVTTENALKWQFIHPGPSTYDFVETDALTRIAQQHNMNIHGHTLVFSEANPTWVQELPTITATDKNNVKKVMIDHIIKVVNHYKGRVSSWDVVNEPLDDESTNLRSHKWYQAMGESYIATAFNAAHQADPNAKLYINDYGLEADGERWDTMLALVTKLKSDGVPIDGVGFQAHVYEQTDLIDPIVLRRHIRQLANINLSARISEMDVYTDDGLDVQSRQYADVFAACFAEPNCTSWTTWGVTDRYNLYLNDDERIMTGQDYLWDKNAKPTPAVNEIQRTMQR